MIDGNGEDQGAGGRHKQDRDAHYISYEEERRRRQRPWSPGEGRRYPAEGPISGDRTTEGAPVSAGGQRGKGPKGYKRTDERLREMICERMTEDDFLDASNIEVEVSNGEVTLNGTVPERRVKRYAEDLVDEFAGVTHVQNNLRTASRRDDKG